MAVQHVMQCDELFKNNKFIPVVTLNNVDKAVPLAHALLAGGISIMEITLRTPNALEVIEKIAKNVPDMIVGAGTILTDNDYHMAVKHHAQFIVSPGFTNDLFKIACDYEVPFLPGAITPSEIMYAASIGFKYLKFFPANGEAGYKILKSLASPFSKIKFCPTGGIDLSNAEKFLNLSNVIGVGCSFLADEKLLANDDYQTITENAKKAVSLAKSLPN